VVGLVCTGPQRRLDCDCGRLTNIVGAYPEQQAHNWTLFDPKPSVDADRIAMLKVLIPLCQKRLEGAGHGG